MDAYKWADMPFSKPCMKMPSLHIQMAQNLAGVCKYEAYPWCKKTPNLVCRLGYDSLGWWKHPTPRMDQFRYIVICLIKSQSFL